MSGRSTIEALERGTQRLIADNRRLRAEVERLREGRAKILADNKRLTETIEGLDNKLTVKELAAGFGRDAGVRVDKLIREVDECIKLVGG